MSRSNGIHHVTCPFCGKKYRLTNWMKRYGPKAGRGAKGERLSNTHLIACEKKNRSPR